MLPLCQLLTLGGRRGVNSMDKMFSGNISRKIAFTQIVCLVGFLGALLFQQINSSKIQSTYMMSDGVTVCFSRLAQTYTAGLLKLTNSPYLKNDFIKRTEECFGQSTVSLENSLSNTFNESKDSLNQLMSGVHWFHEKIIAGPSGLIDSKHFGTQINSRYSKLEATKESIVSSLDKNLTKYLNLGEYALMAVFILGCIFLFSTIILTMGEIKRRRKLQLIESVASKELLKGDELILDHVLQVVSDALLDVNLITTRDMFVKFYNNVVTGRISSFVRPSYIEKHLHEELVTPTQAKQKSSSERPVENAANEIVQSDLINVQLEDVLTNVIDSMAGYLFTRGVFLDLDIEENLWVQASKEGLEQIVFQLISYLSKGEDNEESSKKITIKASLKNQKVEINLINKSHMFNADLLNSINSPFMTDNSCLQIAKSLMNEFDAEIDFSNQISHNGEQMDGLVRLVFEPGTREKRLMGIKKGKKKDLIRDMSN